MTVSISLRWDEGPLNVGVNNAEGELRYVAISDDPANDGRDEVLSALIANAPDTLFGLYIDNVAVTERLSDTDDLAHWDCIVSYILPETKQPYPLYSLITVGQPRPVRLSLRNGTAGTINQTRSLEFIGETTINDAPALKFGTIPALATLINFEATPNNKSVNFAARGIQKSIYNVELVVETVAYASEINAGYGVGLSLNAGKNVINSADWKGFPARCLKFTGFNMKQLTPKRKSLPSSNPEAWEINLTFQYSPPEEIVLPTGFTAISGHTTKQGFEYLDVLYVEKNVTVGVAVFMIPTPARIALHRTEEEVNFDTDLGLGNIM